jgi:hypothetical protein
MEELKKVLVSEIIKIAQSPEAQADAVLLENQVVSLLERELAGFIADHRISKVVHWFAIGFPVLALALIHFGVIQ